MATSVYPLVRGRHNNREDKINAYGRRNKVELAGVSVLADVNSTKATRDGLSLDNNAQLAKAGSSDRLYSAVDLGFSGTGTIPSWNVPGLVGKYMTFAPDDKTRYGVSNAWNVSEKITTGFFKANIDSQVGSVGMRGNVGIQTIRTDQSSTSNCWDSSAPKGSELKPVSDGKTCTDWLPSLNLAFGLGADQTVRLALAKQVARPRVDRLRSWLEFNIDSATGKPSATGGHP